MTAVPLSTSTGFVANDPPEFVPVGTTFASHVPLTDAWSACRSSTVFLSTARSDTALARTLESMGGMWQFVLSGVSGVAAAMPEVFRAVSDTPFAEARLALRSVLREVLSGATPSTGEIELFTGSRRPHDDDRPAPSIQGDRRLYALAAVSKLQRLLQLNQDEVSQLVGVSRPTLWNWQQGRVPQERSIRHLHNVAAAVDLLVDAVGGEDRFDPAQMTSALHLDTPLVTVLAAPAGPSNILARLFGESRRARRLTLMPDEDDLEEVELPTDEGAVDSSPIRRRVVRRRTSS